MRHCQYAIHFPVTDSLRATYSGYAMSQTRSAEHGILGDDMLRTDPQRSHQLGIGPAASVGRSAPLGATVACGGVNFSLYSRDASGIELLFFDHEDDGRPSQRDPVGSNHQPHLSLLACLRSGLAGGAAVWVPGSRAIRSLQRDCVLTRRRSCSTRMVARVAVPRNYSREAARQEGDNAATAMKSVVVDPSLYDWEGDTPLRRPSSQTIIYEMHVKGFTRHPSSDVPEATRGTFRGLIEKVSYLQDLGISAVELLPVFQFDSQDCPPGRVNYWGYAPVSFFAPHQAYSSRQEP